MNKKFNFRFVEVKFPVEWNVSRRILNQSRPIICDFKHFKKQKTLAKKRK